MKQGQRKISKEQYTRAMLNGGRICSEDMDDIFSTTEQCGRGIYSAQADMEDGEYIVKYTIGDSCD